MKNKEALWQFALALYSSPGVEKTLLHLQDQLGANVNLLLWSCWLQKRHIKLTPSLLTSAKGTIAHWDNSVVQSLRHLRRQLKAQEAESPLIKTLREEIKSAELLAERHCLNLLASIPVGAPAEEEPDNLSLYLAQLAGVEEVPVLREALSRAEVINTLK